MKKSFVIIFCVGIMLFLSSCKEKQTVKALKFLTNAEQLELLSLDPFPNKEAKGGFRGYNILGKTTVKNDSKKELLAIFFKALEGEHFSADCFNPRHGIHAVYKGKSVDIVVCFECSSCKIYLSTVKEYESFNEYELFPVGKEPSTLFDKILKDADNIKAKKTD